MLSSLLSDPLPIQKSDGCDSRAKMSHSNPLYQRERSQNFGPILSHPKTPLCSTKRASSKLQNGLVRFESRSIDSVFLCSSMPLSTLVTSSRSASTKKLSFRSGDNHFFIMRHLFTSFDEGCFFFSFLSCCYQLPNVATASARFRALLAHRDLHL